MIDYTTTINSIVSQVENRETSLPIANDACRSKFFFHPQPTAKVCLFFHGFTAGPYQFEPLGRALFAAGYNVLIPLKPGHGIAGNWDGDNPPPLPTDITIYQDYALYWLSKAKQLGEQVIVGGLSTGGTLSSWLAFERPDDIEKALIFAPYLSGNNILVNFFVELLPFYYEWLNKDNPGNFGYKGFLIPTLRLFLDMGQEILERSQIKSAVPMLIVTSDSDLAIDQNESEKLFSSVSRYQPKSWYFNFDKIFEIPHTMMTKLEGNNYQDLLIAIAKSYVESDASWNEVLKIGEQMLQGKTFDTAVSELNLAHRISPDLSVMLSVINKKVLIEGCIS